MHRFLLLMLVLAWVSASADVAAAAFFRSGSSASLLVFGVLTLGVHATVFLLVGVLIGLLDRVLSFGRWFRAAAGGVVMAVITGAWNGYVFERMPAVYIALLAAALVWGGAAAFSAGTPWKAERWRASVSFGIGAVWLAAAAVLYLVNTFYLPGLYRQLHHTAGLFSFFALLAGGNLLLTGVWAAPPEKNPLPSSWGKARVLGLVLGIPCFLSVILVWTVPNDALGQRVRYLLFEGIAGTRDALHVLVPLTDVDRDGWGALLGAGDCAPFDANINPGAREIPDNGVNENCLAGDVSTQAMHGLSTLLKTRVISHVKDSPLPRRREGGAKSRLGGGASAVIMISVDALRIDRATAEPMSSVFSPDVFFRRAYCAFPGTVLSLYSVFTSRPPHAVALERFESFDVPRPDRATTLFQVLESSGVRTHAVVYHDILRPEFGITRGAGTVEAWGSDGGEITSEETTRRALAALDGLKGSRFLLWIHYYDPHSPYAAPGLEEASPEERYDAEVARAAGEIRRFLDEMSSRGVLEETAIILFSDHGEEFMDHGAMYHGQSLYDESSRVPMLLRLPSRTTLPSKETQRVTIIDVPISFLDLAPTILDLFGLSHQRPPEWTGTSLLPLLEGETADTVPVFLEVFQKDNVGVQIGVVSWPWKLIWRRDNQTFELFSLESDPGETRNVYDMFPEPVGPLERLLDAWSAL